MKYFFICEKCGEETLLKKVMQIKINSFDTKTVYKLCQDCGFAVLAITDADTEEIKNKESFDGK